MRRKVTPGVDLNWANDAEGCATRSHVAFEELVDHAQD